MNETVLAFAPHGDDAEMHCGGALAKLADGGAAVHIVVVTDGRRGSFMEESEELAEVRAEEMRRAAAVLGARPPLLLAYPDMALDTLPTGVLRERFVRIIRSVRPDILFAPDPYALYEPHPDHRAVAWAAIEAANFAHLPLVHPEHRAEGLAPHLVRERYFYGKVLPGANRIIDTTTTIDRKLAAVAEHRSQVVFRVEGILRQVAMAGFDVTTLFGDVAASPAALLAWGLREQDEAIGRKAGLDYAEAFRWVRYHPMVEAEIEALKEGRAS